MQFNKKNCNQLTILFLDVSDDCSEFLLTGLGAPGESLQVLGATPLHAVTRQLRQVQLGRENIVCGNDLWQEQTLVTCINRLSVSEMIFFKNSDISVKICNHNK